MPIYAVGISDGGSLKIALMITMIKTYIITTTVTRRPESAQDEEPEIDVTIEVNDKDEATSINVTYNNEPCRSCNRLKFSMLVNRYNRLPNILSAILDKDIYEGDQYYISNNIDTMVNYTYFLENNTYIYHHRYDVAYPIEMTGIAKAFYFTLSYALYILEKDDYLDFIINFSPNDYSTAYTKY